MKKIIGFVAIATLVVVGTKVLRRQNELLLLPAERLVLRDAPNDNSDNFGQLPDNLKNQFNNLKQVGAQSSGPIHDHISAPNGYTAVDWQEINGGQYIDQSKDTHMTIQFDPKTDKLNITISPADCGENQLLIPIPMSLNYPLSGIDALRKIAGTWEGSCRSIKLKVMRESTVRRMGPTVGSLLFKNDGEIRLWNPTSGKVGEILVPAVK